jgi:cobalt-zinc-cadmium efflux system protein
MTHEHDNNRARASQRAIVVSLGIVLFIMIAEVIGGIISNSLALLGDAGHMLVDGLALSLTLFALNIARRPATLTRTFGFHRVEIMVALINGTILALVSIIVFYESYQRFLNPPEVRTPVMLAVAVIGLLGNVASIFLLRRIGKMSLNIKAAFWHIIGDTLSSLGVIAAGIVILVSGWTYADPLVAVLIGFIILWGAVQLVRESTEILLEAVPRQITVEKVVEKLKEIESIEGVHDVHIWTITSGIYALSAHLVTKDLLVSQSTSLVEIVNRSLTENFNISHTTLQLECENCPTGNVCGINTHNNEKENG